MTAEFIHHKSNHNAATTRADGEHPGRDPEQGQGGMISPDNHWAGHHRGRTALLFMFSHFIIINHYRYLCSSPRSGVLSGTKNHTGTGNLDICLQVNISFVWKNRTLTYRMVHPDYVGGML